MSTSVPCSAERRASLKAELRQSVLVGDDEPAHLSQLTPLQKTSEVRALIARPTANLLHPPARLIAVSRAIVAKSGYLMRQVRLLPRAGHPRIHQDLPSG